MLVAIWLSATGDCEVTGEESLPACLGLVILAAAQLDTGPLAVLYDANLGQDGELYCAVSWTQEDGVLVRSGDPAPVVRGMLAIAQTVVGRKLFAPPKILSVPARM